MLNPSQNEQQTLLESFFENREKSNDETAEDSRLPRKRKLHLKENTKSPT